MINLRSKISLASWNSELDTYPDILGSHWHLHLRHLSMAYPRITRCTGGLSPGVIRETFLQVISVPYDPSSVEYEAGQHVDVIPRIMVKQEGVHQNASRAEGNIPNVPIVPEAMMYLCPKISDSPNRNKKEAS